MEGCSALHLTCVRYAFLVDEPTKKEGLVRHKSRKTKTETESISTRTIESGIFATGEERVFWAEVKTTISGSSGYILLNLVQIEIQWLKGTDM